MAKTYPVTLTAEERHNLRAIRAKRTSKSIQVKRAYRLLAADEHGEQSWNAEQIQTPYGVGRCTVERVRQRGVEDGVDVAIRGKQREVLKEKLVDGKVEAHLMA